MLSNRILSNYYIDEFNVIHQQKFEPIQYDEKYLSYYEGLRERTIRLGFLRFGYLVGQFGSFTEQVEGITRGIPDSLLEIGYGSGSFLDAASKSGVKKCYGSDVKEFPLPDDNCSFVPLKNISYYDFTCVAMFDVLEHLPDLDIIKNLRTKFILITVPYCRVFDDLHGLRRGLGWDWFKDWRMRRENEHLHHFNINSLNSLMKHYGYITMGWNHMEDGLRLRKGENGPNTITSLFRHEELSLKDLGIA